jgi:hypothetical protein
VLLNRFEIEVHLHTEPNGIEKQQQKAATLRGERLKMKKENLLGK